MTYRQQHSPTQAAAKAGISRASAYRIENDPTQGSRQKAPRERRCPDPLAGIRLSLQKRIFRANSL